MMVFGKCLIRLIRIGFIIEQMFIINENNDYSNGKVGEVNLIFILL